MTTVEEVVTTDVSDSYVVFKLNDEFAVRQVFPDGRLGLTLFVFETETEAEIARDGLLEHLAEWVEVEVASAS